MNQRIESLVNYIAQVDPQAVNKLAYKFGYHAPVTEEGRRGLMFVGIRDNGDKFLRSMAKHHPDRELILNADGANIEPNVIDLRQAQPAPVAVEKPVDTKNDTLRLVVIVIIVFIIYSIFQKK